MSDNAAKYYKGVFPSPIAPDEVKKTTQYGLATGSAIYQTAVFGGNSYYALRNIRFADSRMFANGKQPFSSYLDLMQINSKNSFTNLDYHPRPVAPKFRDILVNSVMNKMERIDCKALSLDVKNRKDQKKNDAAFRMAEGDFINQVQQEGGIQLEDPNAFTPESEEELDMWSQMNDKEREELLMEEGINFVLYNNDIDAIKREVAGDVVDTGMGWTQNYFDGNNRIRVRRIRPEMMVYGFTNSLDFTNSKSVPYMAHIERMSIVDVRTMWPNIEEEKLYDLARNSIGVYSNPSEIIEYSTDFQLAYTRPYDSFIIDVLFFEYKVTKYINVVESNDKNGNKVIDYGKDAYKPTSPDKKLTKKPIPTIYCGAYLIGSDIVPMWKEQPNQLRNNDDIEDLRYSYSGYILNNDGTMMPKSPMEFMKSSIMMMDIAVLKIQHHLATAAPNGARIDIDSAIELDLGKGIGTVGAMKLREIRLQTGDEYWSSRKQDGSQGRPAIEDAIHPLGDAISQFMNVYNFELNNIRDYIGVNEVTDSASVNPRMGLGVMNNQIQASNNATAHIYGAWVSILTNTAKGVAMRLWDTLKQSDANSMYIKLLGRKNVDFLKYREDITCSNYDVMITVDMSQDDKQFLELNISNALQAGTIDVDDAMVVRDTPNIKSAIKYLSFIKRKRAKEAEQSQMALQQQQAELSQQQAQMAAENQAQLDQLELEKVRQKGAIDNELSLQQLINDSMLKSMDMDSKPIPNYVNALIAKQVQAEMEQEEAEMLAEEQEDEAMMQEEEMAQEQEQNAIL